MASTPFWKNKSLFEDPPLKIEGRYDIAHVLQHKLMNMGMSVSVDIEHPDNDHFYLHGMSGDVTTCVKACDEILKDIQSFRQQFVSRPTPMKE